MWKDWFVAPPDTYLFVALTFVGVFVSIIALTRAVGLRSFSKMSATDFAITVAVGSLFGSAISTKSPTLPVAIFALLCLFGGRWFVSFMRKHLSFITHIVDNQPLMLMEDGAFLDANMKKAKVTHADIRGKLREANVIQLSEVRAVVFEATGDVSVLHCSDADLRLDDEILKGVQR